MNVRGKRFMNAENNQKVNLWNTDMRSLALMGGALLLLIYGFSSGLGTMVYQWGNSEEYGYGYLIPVITLFFIWQKKNELAEKEFIGSWLGVFVVVFGVMLLLFGELAALYVVTQYAFIVAIYGLILSLIGWQAMKVIIAPLLLLFFMVPLPNFLYQGLSSELQLISSSLGVWVIRLFGISVFLEGNVIDLGIYKLQVVEACSGLRYLFPLTCLAYMSAYIFKGAWWKKAILFISSVPITVLMNSFRIGVIGVMVEYWGIGAAEGFLHDFEGWIVFMACMLVLVAEMWLLARIGKDALPFADAFELSWPDALPDENMKERAAVSTFKAVLPIVLLATLVPFFTEERQEIVPERETFADFSMEYPGWQGRSEPLEQVYIDSLKFDDYLMSNYLNNSGDLVNFYVAYYGSQRKGASVHSPKSCIPGGGWRIVEHQVRELALGDSSNLPVNRLLIQNGSNKQLVYYWFDQRGRSLTNEYAVKWYLFWDALTRNRTDGSLVRVIAPVRPGEDVQNADETLLNFVNVVKDDLSRYIPR